MRRREIWFLVLLTFLSVLLSGYGFGISDHDIDIPIIKLYTDPFLYRTDFALSYFGTSAGTPSLLQPAMALVSRVVPLEPLFFVLHIGTLFLTFLAVFCLARLLFGSTVVGYLAVLFLLVAKRTLAWFPTTDIYLVNRSWALPMVLWAIFFFLQRRYVLAFALVGLAWNFHAMSAGFVLIMFISYLVSDLRKVGKVPLLKGLTIFAILTLPWVLWQLGAPSSQMPDWGVVPAGPDMAEVLRIFKWRNLMEQAPFSWGLQYWLYFFSFVSIFLVSLHYPPERWKHRVITTFVAVIGIMILTGIIFTETVPLPMVMQVQLLRSSKFLIIFSLIYGAGYVCRLYEGALVSKLIAVGLVMEMFFLNYPPQSYWFDQGTAASFYFQGKPLVLFLFASLAPAFQPKTTPYRAIVVVAGVFCLVSLVAQFFPYVPVLSLFLVPTRFIVFLGCVGVASILRGASVLNRVPFVDEQASLVALIGIPLLFGLSWVLIQNRGVSHIDFPVHRTPWVDVQLWAKGHTSSDDLFIIPPYMDGFKVFSERGVVGSWKDGGFIGGLDSRFTKEWWERMSNLRCTSWRSRDCRKGYDSLSEGELLALARQYSAAYIITESPKNLALPIAYQNQQFTVYRAPLNPVSLLPRYAYIGG